MAKETIKLETFLNEMGLEAPATDRYLLELFYEAESNFGNDDAGPYEYVEEFSQRGDGQGYETFWVFERKSDGKLFYYYSYDGRVEEYELTECTKEVTTKWSFECNY